MREHFSPISCPAQVRVLLFKGRKVLSAYPAVRLIREVSFTKEWPEGKRAPEQLPRAGERLGQVCPSLSLIQIIPVKT